MHRRWGKLQTYIQYSTEEGIDRAGVCVCEDFREPLTSELILER